MSGSTVNLQLGPFIDVAKKDLASRGLTIVNQLPNINPSIPVAQSKQLVKAQRGYTLLNRLGVALPVLAVVFLGLGVFLARGHRRMLVAAGLGLAGGSKSESIGLRTGPVGPWVYAYRTVVRIAAVVVAALIFVLWNEPTAVVVWWLAVAVALAMAVIEFRAVPEGSAVPDTATTEG
ncbi:hypothetical protein ACWDWO_20190 [Actinopolymorpha singaporensis]